MRGFQLTLWLTRLAWALLGLTLGFIFLSPTFMEPDSVAALLIYTCGLFSMLFLTTVWLMLSYRRFFRTWFGWTTPFLLLLVSNLVVSNIWTVDQPGLSLFFPVLAVASIWLIGLATAILLWYRDVGLGLIGGVMVVFVWSLAVAWRFQGNLMELWLFGLNHPTAPQPLWWLNPLICLVGWAIPLGLMSFVGHTVRLLIKEMY